MKFILILIMYNQAMATAQFEDRPACEHALAMSKSISASPKAIVGYCAPTKTGS